MVIAVAQGRVEEAGLGGRKAPTTSERHEIRADYCALLNCQKEALKSTPAKTLRDLLKPDALLERFAAKKKAAVATVNDFVEIKGGSG